MAIPSLSPFAPCPSCGGWARRPLAPRETRAHCKGCGWRGLLPADAPGPLDATPHSTSAGPARSRRATTPGPAAAPRLDGFVPPSLGPWRPFRSQL